MADQPKASQKEGNGDGILKGIGIASLWGSSFLLSSVNEILGVVIKRNSADSNLIATSKGLAVAVGLGILATVTRFFAMDRSYDTIKDTKQVQWAKDVAQNFLNTRTDHTIAKDASTEQQAQKETSHKTL